MKADFSTFQNRPHFPVLLREVIEYMAPKDGEHIVDGTFGAGGYSYALLNEANVEIMAFDRDPNVFIDSGFFGEKTQKIMLMRYPFSQMKQIGQSQGWEKVDAIVLDIGVSSMQIDEAERGFSFAKDGMLDMRMSQNGLSAADIVNDWSEEDIAEVLWLYGEERRSRKIARNIVLARKLKPITTTFDLKNIIHQSFNAKERATSKIDVATRSFQALRIAVNEELDELKTALDAALSWLNIGGRLVVVSFHSLEDRIVKQFMADKVGKVGRVNKYAKDQPELSVYSQLTKKVVMAQQDEIALNPRSRSAKLRALIKNKEDEGAE
ncbi:MAG: 16S rRNA (cytosine(1402)-N(4))-methyltransferase RsmH [Alphaproteobacteria bacterium]